MMEKHAQRETERERDGDRMVVVVMVRGGEGAGWGFHDKRNSQATQNETLRDQGLGFKED
jgi:hypothetical protein